MLTTEKKRIRDTIKKKRASLTTNEHKQLSKRLSQKLITLPIIQEAHIILGYSSVQKEPDLTYFYEHCLDHNKQLAFPRSEENGAYHFAGVSDLGSDLTKGGFGVLEPTNTCFLLEPEMMPNERVIMLVPGLAFDKEGYRLGYGKGIYDGLLRTYPAYSIGIGYAFQHVDELPRDPWDQRLSLVF